MIIIKRNGSEAAFDKSKIYAAVYKANQAVEPSERISDVEIQGIADRVTEKCEAFGRATSVEEVQDIVEREIMMLGAFTLAKTYITYRYRHALLRGADGDGKKLLSSLGEI